MASITTRAGKGSPLTHAEVDANFNNLNNDKLDIGSAPANSITVASSGRVGIGISSPSGGLQLNNPTAGSAADFVISNPANNWSIKTGTTTNALSVVDNQYSAERLRIDSSGGVGIGTTSIANSPTGASLDVNGPLLARSYINFHQTNAGVLQYSSNETAIRSYGSVAGSGQIVFRTGGGGGSTDFERVRIDAAGRVGIGTASPLVPLHVSGANTAQVGFSGTTKGIRFDFDGTQSTIFGVDNTFFGSYQPLRIGGSYTAFMSGGSEVARIDAAGRLLVGLSTAVNGNVHCIYDSSGDTSLLITKDNSSATALVSAIYHTATTGNNTFFNFYTEATPTLRGGIDYNRGAGQVRYNVTSDRRLKSEIQPANTALDTLAAIQVRSYKWAETGYQVEYGFIAQELNEVAPDAVKEGDDGDEVVDAWAVDNGKLVPLLTKALQEAIAKIETLEAKVAALEAP